MGRPSMSHEIKPKDPADVVGLPLELGPRAAARPLYYTGNHFGPLRARTTLVLAPETLRRAVTENQAVLLLCEEGSPDLPILASPVQSGRG